MASQAPAMLINISRFTGRMVMTASPCPWVMPKMLLIHINNRPLQ
jgi:hypothetical protein